MICRILTNLLSIVLANGTARLQINITKSSGLDFDLLLSSELLGLTKPDPAIYHQAIDILGHKPEECVMVTAHTYDLEAAKKMYPHTLLDRDSLVMNEADKPAVVCGLCTFNAGLRICRLGKNGMAKTSTRV